MGKVADNNQREEMMRKLMIHEFITLDGVIQAPGGPTEDTDGGFTQGGWTQPYFNDEIFAHFGRVMMETDTLLLGAKTWRIHGEAFGPDPEHDPFGDVKKYVVSTTLKSADLWPDSTIISKNVVDEVRALKNKPGKNILLDGSSVLVHTLIENGLIDEYYLHVFPIVLGIGKRLFPPGKQANLKLLESAASSTGVVYLRYQPA